MAKEVCIVNNECFNTEYPVGSTISIEGVNCKVVEDIGLPGGNCHECILNGKRGGIMCMNLACLNTEREDHKDVHFIKIRSVINNKNIQIMKVRITNNKNIQTMEQKDIDIYEILKGEEYGTELYTPKCGRVWHSGMANDKDSAKAIWTEDEAGREHFFDKNGKIYKEGEVLLFPSKEMRDWSKFFKKGDVLVSKDREVHIIFEKFEDDAFTKFRGKHYLWKECYNEEVFQMETSVFEKASDDDAQTYINSINKCFGGKLNRETLEIEKPAKLTFEVGKLYVFNEEDEDGELTIIGELIAKNESEDTLTFGNQYEIENEKFVTDQAFDLRISVNKELREATELEVELFNKHYAIWKKEKEAKEQPAFKTFDKVLVRDGKEYEWLPALFVRDRGEGANYRYKVLSLRSGKPAEFACCIPYEGNENIIFTDRNIDNLPF